MQARPDTVKLVNGDLISETFFINMAEIVNDMLLTGVPALGVTELAQQFALPADQVRACLKSHAGSLIDGEIPRITKGLLFSYYYGMTRPHHSILFSSRASHHVLLTSR